MANGMRQILLLLMPATAAILVLSEPMTRLVYQRGEFDASQTDLVATALFWFAFSLPFNGLFLLLTRTFFSLQRPWLPTAISAGNLVVTAGFALALYSEFEVAGIVAATGIATAGSVVAQAVILRRHLGRLELGRLAMDHGAHPRRVGRPRRGRPTSPGTCSTTRSGAGLGGQIALAGHRARRRRHRLRDRGAGPANPRGPPDHRSGPPARGVGAGLASRETVGPTGCRAGQCGG